MSLSEKQAGVALYDGINVGRNVVGVSRQSSLGVATLTSCHTHSHTTDHRPGPRLHTISRKNEGLFYYNSALRKYD